MVNYIETYNVLGRCYGIEDFKSPGEHFFDGKDVTGKPRLRFMLWAGGCGLDNGHKTLREARKALLSYIRKCVLQELSTAKARVKLCNSAIHALDKTDSKKGKQHAKR